MSNVKERIKASKGSRKTQTEAKPVAEEKTDVQKAVESAQAVMKIVAKPETAAIAPSAPKTPVKSVSNDIKPTTM